MIRVLATACKAKELVPGELFSTAGPEFWSAISPDSVAERIWIRTNAPLSNPEGMVYRVVIVKNRKRGKGRIESDGDVCANRHGGNEMSVEAYEKTDTAPLAYAAAEVMHDTYRDSKRDWNSYEMEQEFEVRRLGNHSMSGRFTDLKRWNLIFKTENKRPTASGRRAQCWRWRVATDPGPPKKVEGLETPWDGQIIAPPYSSRKKHKPGEEDE